jgi:hypothetical protein
MKRLYLILALIIPLFIVGCSNPEKKALNSFKPIIVFLSSQTNTDGSITFSDFSYNVEKSDSLVSPFIGVITFKADSSNHKAYYAYTCHFAEQDGKWIHKSIDIEYQVTSGLDPNATNDGVSDEIRAQHDQAAQQFNQQVLNIFKTLLDNKLSAFLNCPKIYTEE